LITNKNDAESNERNDAYDERWSSYWSLEVTVGACCYAKWSTCLDVQVLI